MHPHPDSLHIVTKVGANRDPQGGWPTARRPEDLRQQVQANLDALGIATLDVVNMRMGDARAPQPGPLGFAFEALVELQRGPDPPSRGQQRDRRAGG